MKYEHVPENKKKHGGLKKLLLVALVAPVIGAWWGGIAGRTAFEADKGSYPSEPPSERVQACIDGVYEAVSPDVEVRNVEEYCQCLGDEHELDPTATEEELLDRCGDTLEIVQ